MMITAHKIGSLLVAFSIVPTFLMAAAEAQHHKPPKRAVGNQARINHAQSHHAPARVIPGPVKRVPSVGPVYKNPHRKNSIAKAVASLLTAPPHGYVVENLSGVSYYRVGSVYYRRIAHQGAYVYVVADPTLISVRPTHLDKYETVVFNGAVHYRLKPVVTVPTTSLSMTAAIETQPDFYQTTIPSQATTHTPAIRIGATVSQLPPSAQAFSHEATTYFEANGAYYLPIGSSGNSSYVVVPSPLQ